jgi:hypothetical protein
LLRRDGGNTIPYYFMDLDTYVKEWILRISKVQKNKHPICPFAKRAKYLICEEEDKLSMENKAKNFDVAYDIYICFPSNQSMSVNEAKSLEKYLNTVSKSTITLLDHYKDPGFIDSVYTGNGKKVVFLIQNKEELLKARKSLHSTNYYDSWDKEYYKKITETGK